MPRTAVLLLLCATLMSGVAHATKMYKWVDENGVTHFSTRQPPRVNTDTTKLQGGNLEQPRVSTESSELTKVKRQELINTGWQGCDSAICQLVQQIDQDCQTSFCSRAKHYSDNCTSVGCQTKKLAFEKDMRDRVAERNRLLQQQAINANSVPVPPASQNQD
jgi:hypothetical protein